MTWTSEEVIIGEFENVTRFGKKKKSFQKKNLAWEVNDFCLVVLNKSVINLSRSFNRWWVFFGGGGGGWGGMSSSWQWVKETKNIQTFWIKRTLRQNFCKIQKKSVWFIQWDSSLVIWVLHTKKLPSLQDVKFLRRSKPHTAYGCDNITGNKRIFSTERDRNLIRAFIFFSYFHRIPP